MFEEEHIAMVESVAEYIRLFEDAYLNTNTGSNFVDKSHSSPVQPSNQTFAISVTVPNMDSGLTLDLEAQGSYDGKTWKRDGLSATDVTIDTSDAGGNQQAPFSKSSASAVATDYAFLRLYVYIQKPDGEDGGARFSAGITFSHQQ